MARTILTPALALGAVLALGGTAAADDSPARAGVGGFTMTLGGQGTAAQAAAEDNELTHGWRRGWGWGGGWGGGWGYRPHWGWNSWGWHRPYWGGGWNTWNSWNSWGWHRPYWGGGWNNWGWHTAGFGFGGGFGGGFYCISGTKDDASAPVVSLGMSVASNPFVPREPAVNGSGAPRYDGGPASPVPLPKPEASPAGRPAPAVGLPVSLPKTGPASPYTYKAYGEK